MNTSVVSKEEKKKLYLCKSFTELKKKRHSFLLKYCTMLCLGETDRIAGKAPVQMSLIRDQFMAILLSSYVDVNITVDKLRGCYHINCYTL